MMHIPALLLNLAGLALLLVAMSKHQHDWLRRKLPAAASRNLRAGGFMLLGLAFLVAVAGLGWLEGTLAWFGWLTVAGIATVAANTNRERIQRWGTRL
jgi:hypothetical protein